MKNVLQTITRNGRVLVKYDDGSATVIVNGVNEEWNVGSVPSDAALGFGKTKTQKCIGAAATTAKFAGNWGIWKPTKYFVLEPAWELAKKARYALFIAKVAGIGYAVYDPTGAKEALFSAINYVKDLV